MKPFADYFSTHAIIEEICAQRIKLKNKRHAGNLYDAIFKDRRSVVNSFHDSQAELIGLLPPRSVWSKYRQPLKKRRKNKSKDMDLEALRKAVRRLIKEEPSQPWVHKLLDRASLIRHKALHCENPCFSYDRIIGQMKNPDSREYRPITIYKMDDNIIQKITARYLSLTLDFCFSDASCAYRRSYPKDGNPINRESALRRVAEFRAAHDTIYVAEADLRNFMDCVDHETARNSLRKLIKQAKRIDPAIDVDPRAIQLYDASLDSYSFKRDVLKKATDMLKLRDRRGRFIWPIEELAKIHSSQNLDTIGIPQGGALSCFVVNVMLHEVDQAVESTPLPDGHKLCYLRFCDDMLILSTNRDACHTAMESYLSAIKAKMLLAHDPIDMHQMDNNSEAPNFLDVKSKKPYLWANQEAGGIPQIQFLGYLIRNDGQFQIRPKSIHKQVRKICDETKKLIRRIQSADKVSESETKTGLIMQPHEVLMRFYMKLVAMSVGRRNPRQSPPKCSKDIKPMCWADGYKLLWETYYDPTQLKELDYHREQSMQRIFNELKPFMNTKGSKADAERVMSKFREHGFGYSYYGQFAGTIRPE